jgi:hypothetical protein
VVIARNPFSEQSCYDQLTGVGQILLHICIGEWKFTELSVTYVVTEPPTMVEIAIFWFQIHSTNG